MPGITPMPKPSLSPPCLPYSYLHRNGCTVTRWRRATVTRPSTAWAAKRTGKAFPAKKSLLFASPCCTLPALRPKRSIRRYPLPMRGIRVNVPSPPQRLGHKRTKRTRALFRVRSCAATLLFFPGISPNTCRHCWAMPFASIPTAANVTWLFWRLVPC